MGGCCNLQVNKMAVWNRLKQLTRLRQFQWTKRGAATKEYDASAVTRTQEEISKYVKENEGKMWKGYGKAAYSRNADWWEYHLCYAALTLFITQGFWWYYYKGDHLGKNWARREAVLLVRAREAAGVPYVDMNYADPRNLELPSDEELGGARIVM